MSQDKIQLFERWRKTLPRNTLYLTDIVIKEIIPEFMQRGFDRFPDYAGGGTYAVGPNCIPLQRRSGTEWPTIEILFDKRGRPTFGVNFAMLPEICGRLTEHGTKEIPRLAANVVEGPDFFILCKGKRVNFDCNFGMFWFTLWPKSKLEADVAFLKSILPWLFEVLEDGIPKDWHEAKPGYVAQYAFKSSASRSSKIY